VLYSCRFSGLHTIQQYSPGSKDRFVASKKILFLATGGTIASKRTPRGAAPAFGATDLLKIVPGIQKYGNIHVKELMRIDSSNMQPENWVRIAKTCFQGLAEHNGVIISHGTHTMAYTASALTFMLQNLHKPVVLTGAQIPSTEKRTDAVRNLTDSLCFACDETPGVFIVFNSKVIRGCRATKTSTDRFDAFESINSPIIATIRDEVIHYSVRPPLPEKRPSLHTQMNTSVCVLKLTPGTEPSLLEMIGNMGYRALVIECFGTGGVPLLKRNLLPAVRSLTGRGTIVVASSQCVHGGVDLNVYDVGKKSLDAGVFSGLDMTTETIVTKLMWALGRSTDPETVKKIMHANYADELTPGYRIRIS
jgi:L-asparaginase